MVKLLALHCSIVEKIQQTLENDKHAQECMTSFLNQQKQNTMDHSNVLNMAQERTSKISTLPFHWLF
jgi:hypothetical protein